MGYKFCFKCKQTKPFSDFYNNKKRKDKLTCWCKECGKEDRLKYHYNNLNKENSRSKKYSLLNKNILREKSKKHKSTEEYRKYFNNYFRNWLNFSPSNRIASNLRTRVGQLLKNKNKSQKTAELLGCSFKTFQQYLESQFKPGMSWTNYGLKGWHIDHIKPCKSFDLTKLEEQKKCFHYTNLQPLWAEENWAKGSKISV